MFKFFAWLKGRFSDPLYLSVFGFSERGIKWVENHHFKESQISPSENVATHAFGLLSSAVSLTDVRYMYVEETARYLGHFLDSSRGIR